VDLVQALLLLLRDNPAAIQGFIAGMVAAVLVDVIHWRWEVRKRPHPNGSKPKDAVNTR